MSKTKRTDRTEIRIGRKYKRRLQEMADARSIPLASLCRIIVEEYVDNDRKYLEREIDRLIRALVAIDAKIKLSGTPGYRDEMINYAREALK